MKYLRNDPEMKQQRRELRRNQTEAERVFWSQIRNRQLHSLRFIRQYSAGPYILDFYCPAMHLAIELDGGQHGKVDHEAHDADRTAYLKGKGVEVMRFWNNEGLSNIEGVLSRIGEK